MRAVVRENQALGQKEKGEERMKWNVVKLKDGLCSGKYQLITANKLDKEIDNIE